MTCDKEPLRIVSTNEVWDEVQGSDDVAFSHTAIIAYSGDTAYYGTTTAQATDIDQETILKDLRPIPRETIYPRFSSHLTRAPEIYVKKPNLRMYSLEDEQNIADRLLHEAEIYEILRKNPHPALGQSLGCIVGDDGRITGLALVKYDSRGLFERAFDPQSFGEEQRESCIETLKSAVQHLHNLGLAHNDLTPLNVMFTEDGEPVLIDFETCHPIGTRLTKGGNVGEWEDGIPVAVYESSSADCDKAGIEQINIWLKKTYDEKQSKNETRKEKSELLKGPLEETNVEGKNESIEISEEGGRERDSKVV